MKNFARNGARRRAVLTLLGVGLVATGLQAGEKDGTFDIYWIDSQGGGSTLLVSPGNESVLIDAGNPGGRDPARIHRVATEVAGLRQIDHLIVTHLHVDHFGGAPELAQLIPIQRVYDNGIPERDPDGRNDTTWPLKVRAYREMKTGERVVVKPGDRRMLRGAAGAGALVPRFTFVAARQQVALATDGSVGLVECRDPQPKAPDPSDNANSVVTLVEFGDFRFFNGGDLTWQAETRLVCPIRQLDSVDVFQVNHHGMDVSNNPLLLQALAPTVAVFNNGPRKGCAPAVVTALHQLPSLQAIYQVHRNQQHPEANAPAEHCANDRETGGNYVKLSVAPDGRSYTVSIPATGHQRTLLTRF